MGGLNSGPHRSTRLREATARRFDVLALQAQSKAEGWQEGRKHTPAFRAPHTGTIITTRVVLTFTDQRFGGRSYISQPYSIACAKCQRISYAPSLEGKERRWRGSSRRSSGSSVATRGKLNRPRKCPPHIRSPSRSPCPLPRQAHSTCRGALTAEVAQAAHQPGRTVGDAPGVGIADHGAHAMSHRSAVECQ
jgi:hypothetical protein